MIKHTLTYKEKIPTFFRILLPVFATQISLEAIPFFGTVMSGQSSPQDLVGVAVGSSLWVPVFVGLCGILASIIPIVANHLGAEQKEKITPAVMQGIYLSLVVAFCVLLLGYLVVPSLLAWTNIEPKAHLAASGYLSCIALGVPFLFLFSILRGFMDGLGQTRKTMWVTFTVIPINGFFNWVLISGRLGFPALGGAGAGLSAAITYMCLTVFAFIMVRTQKEFISYQIFKTWPKPSLKAFKEQLKIGLPIGLAIFCEISIFAAVTFLMSRYGTMIMAAHQAAANFSGLLYMIPLSISMALTILVGYESGAKRYKDAQQYAYIGIIAASLVAIFSTSLIYFNSRGIAALYSQDPGVQDLTISFLFYVQFFFLVDAIAAPIQGTLRGYKDVRVTFLLAMISYWVAGLPVGWILATYGGFGPYGYWMGLVSGLVVGAIGLIWRMYYIRNKFK